MRVSNNSNGFDGLFDNISSGFSKLLDTGAQIYQVKTAKEIEEAKAKTASLLLQGQQVALTAPPPAAVSSGGGFSAMPVLLGVGAIGIIALMLTRRR